MKNLTFVIVDDAIFMRTLLKKMIDEVENYHIVGEGSNGYEAIEQAKKQDIILIAGKGHETYQEINGVRYPFSDKKYVKKALKKYKTN